MHNEIGLEESVFTPESTMKRAIYSVLPTPVRIQGRSYFNNYLLDLWYWLSRNTDSEIPPRHLNISGTGSFRALGRHNLSLCRALGHLQPDDSVLDVGCGIGRTALAMTEFLSASGSYSGLDAIDFAIRWCQSHIASRYPNFSFVHADVYNKAYNRRGRTPPERYSFPFEDASFTFSLASSLFTHLLPTATERYVAEVGRVLRPGGVSLYMVSSGWGNGSRPVEW